MIGPEVSFYFETSQHDLASNSELIAYPNPAIDFISFKNITISKGQLNIYNADGKLNFNTVIHDNENIDISFLESGMFIYELLVDGQKYVGRFVTS